MAKDIFDRMAEQWPAEIVARCEIEKFTGGAVKSKSMANMDCQGSGPAKQQIGRKVIYDKNVLAGWLRARSN